MTIATEPVLHGYTMGDLDQIAKSATRNRYSGTFGADHDELYEAAWGAAVETLCAQRSRPERRDLHLAAMRGVDETRYRIQRDRGVISSQHSAGTYAAPGFLRYWINPPSGSPVEDKVVDSIAVQQVLAAMRPTHRQRLVLLAAYDGDLVAAGAASGHKAFTSLAWVARRAALALWHDGETPRRVWVESTAGRRRTSPCGTVAAYRRHRKHREQPCEFCRQALSEHMARAYQVRKARAALA